MDSDFDLGELMLEVEDTFGFSIPETDMADLSSIGRLYDYVLARRLGGKQDACLTSMVFYKLRRALMSVLQLPRDALRVSTELSTIIPRRRRRTWRAIEKTTCFRLPLLRRPQWFVRLATLAAVGLGAATPALLGLRPFGGGVIVAVLSMCVFAYVLFWLTASFAYMFPPDVSTVGQLAKATLARNYQRIVAESKRSATDAEVWDILRRIVAEQLGVRPEQLTKETDLIKDVSFGLLGGTKIKA
ncbi:MAG: hypothetical protein WCB27_26170 [Thermoguttaceae bacterium]|jgi:acyl carrier protein